MIGTLISTLRTGRLAIAISAFTISLLATTYSYGQVAAPFIGTWKATWQTEKKLYEALMTVTEAGGTWQTATYDKGIACAGREVPMKVVSQSQTEVQIQLMFSEVISGCQNPTVVLKAAPDGTVTGTRGKYELILLKK